MNADPMEYLLFWGWMPVLYLPYWFRRIPLYIVLSEDFIETLCYFLSNRQIRLLFWKGKRNQAPKDEPTGRIFGYIFYYQTLQIVPHRLASAVADEQSTTGWGQLDAIPWTTLHSDPSAAKALYGGDSLPV